MPGTGTVVIHGITWQVDVATTLAERQQGLGGLASIPPHTGMLFDMGATSPITVTTVPMLFNLDVLFLSATGEVVEIQDNIAPGNEVSVATPCRYFLEVNGGEAADVDIGDMAEITIQEAPPPQQSQMSAILQAMTPIMIMGMVFGLLGGMMGSVNGPQDKMQKPRTAGHHSISGQDRRVLERRFGRWAVKIAEDACPDDDTACVERKASELCRIRYGDGWSRREPPPIKIKIEGLQAETGIPELIAG